MTMRTRTGMTLTELLIAMALTTIVAMGAITGILQMRVMIQRAEAQMAMHDTARIIYERLSGDLGALQQTGCFFVTCTASTPTVPGTVELVFLKSRFDQFEFTLANNYGKNSPSVSDLTWTRWAWNGPARQLTVASNPLYRSFSATAPATATLVPYMALPTPQQFTKGAITPAAVLNADAYGTGATGDVGDYQDLLNRAVPIAVTCSAFRCDVVTQAAANSFSANPNVGSLTYWADGMRVDGLVRAANTDFGKRPRIIRVQFVLTDSNLNMSCTFSFSFQTPGQLPG